MQTNSGNKANSSGRHGCHRLGTNVRDPHIYVVSAHWMRNRTTDDALLLTFENPAERPHQLFKPGPRAPVWSSDAIARSEIRLEVAPRSSVHHLVPERDIHFVVVFKRSIVHVC